MVFRYTLNAMLYITFHWYIPGCLNWLILIQVTFEHYSFVSIFFCILLWSCPVTCLNQFGILELSTESRKLKRLLPTKELFDFIVLKVICLDVRVWLRFSSIQSISGNCELHNLFEIIKCSFTGLVTVNKTFTYIRCFLEKF